MSSAIKVTVNMDAIRRALDGKLTSNRKVQEKSQQVASGIFFRNHAAMMKDYFSNAITQELKAGNTASNISDTLNGEGNLFAFLGFMAGQDPTYELEDLLLKIRLGYARVNKNSIVFKIEGMPTKAEITRATRMNWGNGTSWAFAVETGAFGGDADLAHFIFKSWSGGRSQQGFQVKGYEYSEEEFSPKPYISEILNNFSERMTGSRSKYLI